MVINKSPKVKKSPIPFSIKVPKNKAIPLTMEYMERIMTKIKDGASHPRKRKMLEATTQT
jgi:hypothetical protein